MLVCFVYFRSGRNFIRDVVLRLLSRGTNFHSSKHQKLYTRRTRQFEIHLLREFTHMLFVSAFLY